MSLTSFFAPPALNNYIEKFGFRESSCLRQLRQAATQCHGGSMQTAPEVAQLLAFLIRITQAKHVLELGTFAGYSALAMSQALPEDGTLVTCDRDEKPRSQVQEILDQAPDRQKITFYVGLAQDFLSICEKEKRQFDMIYIDCNKRQYDLYYEQALKLTKPSGIIALDNTLFGGGVLSSPPSSAAAQALHELNVKLAQDARVTHLLLPLSDGVTLLMRK